LNVLIFSFWFVLGSGQSQETSKDNLKAIQHVTFNITKLNMN
jgi:hypothetical protein